MAFSPREYRAIQYVTNRHHWKLSLCTSPIVFYIDNTGKTIKQDIKSVIAEYDQGRKADLAQDRRKTTPMQRRYFG